MGAEFGFVIFANKAKITSFLLFYFGKGVEGRSSGQKISIKNISSLDFEYGWVLEHRGRRALSLLFRYFWTFFWRTEYM